MPKIISIAVSNEVTTDSWDCGESMGTLSTESTLYGLGNNGNLYLLDNDTWIEKPTRFPEPFSNCCDAECEELE